jgi:sec-independent protein translocase protein TatA
MFGTIGAPELIIIGLLVLLLFGAGRVAGLGKDLGVSIREFRKAMHDDDGVDPEVPASPAMPAAPRPEDEPAPAAGGSPLVF